MTDRLFADCCYGSDAQHLPSEPCSQEVMPHRNLDITNADHIALWIEHNTIPDEPMNQCASWLACRIVEAHEAALTRMTESADDALLREALEAWAEYDGLLRQYDGPLDVLCAGDMRSIDEAYDRCIGLTFAALKGQKP